MLLQGGRAMAGILNINNVPNLSNKKLTSKLSFEIGQTFSAKVVSSDESNRMLTLRLPDGWQFPAALEKSAEFTGEGLIRFQVVGYENGVIQLSIVESKDITSHKEEDAIESALSEQNLNLSKEDFELLISMLKHNLPLTKENIINVKVMMDLKNEIADSSDDRDSFIQKYLNSKNIQSDSPEASEIKEILNDFFDKLNNASEEDILTLMENGIDVTGDNLKSFNNIVKGQETIYKDLGEMKNEIVKEYNFESSNSSSLMKNEDVIKLLAKMQTVDTGKILDRSTPKVEQAIKEDIRAIVNDFFDKVEEKGKYDAKAEQKFVSFIGMDEEDGTAEDKGLITMTEQIVKQGVADAIDKPVNKLVNMNLAVLKESIKGQQVNENNLGKAMSDAETSIFRNTSSVLQNGLGKLIDDSMGKMINDMLMGGVSPQNSTISNLQDKRGSIEPLINKLQEDINASIKTIVDNIFSDVKEQVLSAEKQNQTSDALAGKSEAAADSVNPGDTAANPEIENNNALNEAETKIDSKTAAESPDESFKPVSSGIEVEASKVPDDTLSEKTENLKQFAKDVQQVIDNSYDETKASFKQEAVKLIDNLLKYKLENIKNETKEIPLDKELEDFSQSVKSGLQDLFVKQNGKEISSFKLTKIIEDVLKDRLSSLNDTKNRNFNEIKEQVLLKTEDMKNTIRDLFEQKLELKPEMYSKVLDAIKSNISDFKIYNSLSNQYYLLDLPINYKEKEYECKIMVKDDRKRGKKIDSNNVKFVVTVNTINIGTVDAFLEVKNSNININIKCDSQWIKVLNQRKEKLLKDIRNMGYNVSIGFTQRKEAADLVSARDFFNDKTIGVIDIRV